MTSNVKKSPRVCPFCNGTSSRPKVSSEHIWPEWAKDILPQRPKKREFLYKGWEGFKEVKEVRKDFTREGSPSGVTLPVPCVSCNNEWMSRIEIDAKPILHALAVGSCHYLSSQNVEKLARWCFLKFTIVSCMPGEIWCTSIDDRKNLMKSGEIASPFILWLFKHDVENWADRNTWHSIRGKSEVYQNSLSEPHNLNTFTIGFGKAVFFMAFRWGIDFNPWFSPDRAAKLWPQLVPAGIVLPSTELDASEIEEIAHTLPNAVGS